MRSAECAYTRVTSAALIYVFLWQLMSIKPLIVTQQQASEGENRSLCINCRAPISLRLCVPLAFWLANSSVSLTFKSSTTRGMLYSGQHSRKSLKRQRQCFFSFMLAASEVSMHDCQVISYTSSETVRHLDMLWACAWFQLNASTEISFQT